MSEAEIVQYPQMIVSNMPKHYARDDFEKFLAKSSIQFRKVKIVPNKTFTFTEEDRDHAINEINVNKIKYKNYDIYAGIRTENKRDRPNKRSHDGDESEKKKMKSTPTVTNINDVVCPWWNISYEEQLQKKQEAMREECLHKIRTKLRSSFFESNDMRRKNRQPMLKLPDWLDKTAAPIPLNPILASPETIHNYRNKCEFTFGYAAEEVTPEISPEESSEAQSSDPSTAIASAETEPSPQSQEPGTQKVATPATSPLPSLGFRVSSYKDGILVASPEGCPHIPFPMVEVVKIFKAHIRGSELKVYDQYQHNGVWRLLTVRYSERTNQMILMLCVSLKGIAEDLWSQEKQTLIEKISQAVIYPTSSVSAEAVPVVIRGFQLQVYDGISVPLADHPVETLFGDDHIMEQMNNCQFKVSPQAFFQVNTPVAEILYNQVVTELKGGLQTPSLPARDLSSSEVTLSDPEGPPLLCLDICCGTGTIGIICSKANLGSVVGIEMCPAAVENAKLNAELNGLTLLSESPPPVDSSASSCHEAAFICSKAETVLENILTEHRRTQDPMIPRIQALARGKKLLAVVDPPREGLHIDCLRAIRACSRIERLVYVSCNPTKSLIQDCIALCGPSTKRLTGTAFKPLYGTPVDLFPMTPHCEMILVFERDTSAS